MRALVHVVEEEPRFTKAVTSWLNTEDCPYLVLGSTSVREPGLFALGARDLTHLLKGVLGRALTLLSTSASGSSAGAIDERLNHRIVVAWKRTLLRASFAGAQNSGPETSFATTLAITSGFRGARSTIG